MRKKIEVKRYERDYLNARETFLSLTAKTYPHGHETEVLDLLPKLEKDAHGNYYKLIGGSPTTMFTSHLDTADHRQNNTERYSNVENGIENIATSGETILGADDKAGVTVMLYMMEKNVPGLYYFFIGEERGGIGSKRLANDLEGNELVKNVVRCVSFDRRGTGSVITKQLGQTCCSDAFAKALCGQYNSLGMDMSPDPTGIFTDSAMLMGNIAECTNISVGYMNEHTGKEVQNMTHLEKLCEVSCKVDWDSLPTKRDVNASSGDDEFPSEYKKVVKLAKTIDTFSGVEEDMAGWSLYFDLEGWAPSKVAEDLSKIMDLVKAHNLETTGFMQNGYLVVRL